MLDSRVLSTRFCVMADLGKGVGRAGGTLSRRWPRGWISRPRWVSRVAPSVPKVFVVGPYPPPVNGASRIGSIVVTELRKRDVSVRVLDMSPAAGVIWHASRVFKHGKAVLQLLLHARRGSVLYQTGAGGRGIWYQVVLAFVARLLGLGQVFHHHSYAYLNSPSTAMKALTRTGGGRMKHVALSDGMARRIKSLYGAERVLVLSNATLLDAPGPQVRRRREMLWVGHLSNLSIEKGVLFVLRAVSEMRRIGLQVTLRLAGPATDAFIVECILKHMSEHPEDEWLGSLDPADVPAYMQSLDCFLFPSQYINEALPLVVLEALREGTPVVATAVGCLPELLESAGWLAPADPEVFARRVQEVLGDHASRQVASAVYADQYRAGSTELFVREILSA